MTRNPGYEELAERVKELEKASELPSTSAVTSKVIDTLTASTGRYVWEWDLSKDKKLFSSGFSLLRGLKPSKRKLTVKTWMGLSARHETE